MVRPSRQVLVWGFAAALVTYALISAGFAQPATPTAKAPPVPDPLTPDALLARAAHEGAPVWADGDVLTMVYRGEGESVEVCCGLQEPLRRLPGSDVWVLRRIIPDLGEAVISYDFTADGDFDMELPDVWRGPDAPPPPERTNFDVLKGEFRPNVTFRSAHLDEWRGLSVYLPPGVGGSGAKLPVVYMADGESAGAFAQVLEPLVVAGRLPPFAVVGFHSPPPPASADAPDLRGQEYIPSFNPAHFRRHEAFVLREVIPWAEANLPVSRRREDRAVFGYSNGGVFAAAMGLRHPDVFGHALAFSLGVEPGPVMIKRQAADFYLVAGTLEEGFIETTRDLALTLREGGIDAHFKNRVAGHDFLMWEEELPGAVAQAFGRR